jgi:3D-(3,5/4)-trihydroxycyclohexane-1,2-dione acylhydrolase (decyclizing)
VFAADTRDEVLDALARAREVDGPVVIVVLTAPHVNLPPSGVWWDVAPAAVSPQPWLDEKRQAYQEGLATQRWHG